MNRFIRVLIVTAGMATLSVAAQAADIFMLVQGVPGDATAKGHEGWIRVASLDLATTAVVSITAVGGASVGKPSPAAFEFAIASGPWSAQILRQITTGRAYPKVTFDAVAADGRPIYRMTLDVLYITQYRLASLTATPLPQDLLKGVFRTVRIDYYSTGADGRLVTTSVQWDIPTGDVQ